MMAMTSAPRLYLASSDASGRFTLMMTSASLSASALTVAPAAVNSESGRPDLVPAPGSIAISMPSALNFFTVSGEAATRGSDGSISFATAIFMTSLRLSVCDETIEQVNYPTSGSGDGLDPRTQICARVKEANSTPPLGGYHVSPKGRNSTLNDQALRS